MVDGFPVQAMVFVVEICAIFAREILEACVIIGQYRRVVKLQDCGEEAKNKSLRIIWISAGVAAFVALGMIVILGIALNAAGNELDEKACDIIEGVSKIVAAICIAQLSLKIPKWLGYYTSSKEKNVGVTASELWFNVAWNIWREIAEIGAFLIPFFLNDDNLSSIPLSGLIGVVIALVPGFLIYYINGKLTDKKWLAIFMVVLTGWLSTGLFIGGCHEIEEVAGETPYAWKLEVEALSKKKFPMVMLKPFGWSDKPTVLMVVCFPIWAILIMLAHYAKFTRSHQREGTAKGSTEIDDGATAMSPRNKPETSGDQGQQV